MDESEDNLSSEDIKSNDSAVSLKTKAKKRSLIERELETSLTARITSPLTNGDGTNTSRYGRARCRKSNNAESTDAKNITSESKSPITEKSPIKIHSQSPVYKMHASNSPLKIISPKKGEKFLDNQIESIYQENILLSRFSNEEDNAVTPSPVKKYPKVYIRKDLIQKREAEDTVMVIQNMFSPVKSVKKSSNTHLNNILERSCERYSLNDKQNGYMVDNSSVVKTLDFDSKKKKKEIKDNKTTPSKNDIFEMEAKCAYQVGDLAWARMGTYPFWPSIVTRDPSSGTFVKKKLFGRIERDVIHVTFFGDNGRRSWIVDNMLRKYLGQFEFESTRNKFSPEDKKKDPRLYAAYFISEKKQALWNRSVEEAEILLREPKRLRIDIFNDMLVKSRSCKVKQPKSKVSRANSDVSLSESLYDSLFSEEDGKSEICGGDRSRIRSRNKSLDMFEVVTACLDNMAAKTGITKIQKQSHMDIWLQKAKSKTPEKTKAQTQMPVKKIEDIKEIKFNKKKSTPPKKAMHKGYSLRKKSGFHDYTPNTQVNNVGADSDHTLTNLDNKQLFTQDTDGLGVIVKVESLAEKTDGTTSIELPVDKIASCESETFTDESEDSNNFISSTSSKTIHEMESQMKESNTSSISNDNPQLEKHQDSETITDTNSGYDSTKVSNFQDSGTDTKMSMEKTNTENLGSYNLENDLTKIPSNFKQNIDLDIKTTTKITMQEQNSENLESNNLKTSGDHQGLENNLAQSVENQGPKSENNNVLRKSFQNQILDTQSNITFTKINENQNLKVVPSIESHNTITKSDVVNMYLENQAGIELQQESKLASILQDKDYSSGSVSMESSTTDLQSQNLSTDGNYILSDNNKQIMSYNKKDKEDISRTLSKEFNIAVTQEDNLNTVILETEDKGDEFSTDEDSDSERLPYSPLSNLGNNSDDNLSLDDVPFVNDNNMTEYETQVIETVNKVVDKSRNLVDKDIIKENLNVDLKIKNHGFVETMKEKTMANISKLSHNMAEAIVTNDKISKKEYVNNNLKEIVDFDKGNVNNVDEEVPISRENSKESVENISTNGYQGKNIREIDMASKEVSIYVSNTITATTQKNGFNEINRDCNVNTTSIYSQHSTVSTETDAKYISFLKQTKKQDNPLENPNFIKYMELRQDALLDENPELNENQIVAYLHKTWLYEESIKSDVKKNDDLKECNLVRGLNLKDSGPPARKKNLTLKKSHSSKSNNSGNLKMFLRRKKDIEKKQGRNELYSADKKATKRNIIRDDDSPVSKEEWHILPIKELEIIDVSASDGTKNEGINETESLSGDVKESILEESKTEDIKDKKEYGLELGESFEKHSKSSNNTSIEIMNKSLKMEEQKVFTESDVRESSRVRKEKNKLKVDLDNDLIDSENSEAPIIKCKLRSKAKREIYVQEDNLDKKINDDADTISINSADSDISTSKHKKKLNNKKRDNAMEDPAFIKYLELRQDALVDENPNLTQDEIVAYLYQTWMYEENTKSDMKKNDDFDQLTMVKGLKDAVQQPKKIRRKIPKTEKDVFEDESPSKDKPKRKSVKPFYNEEYSDFEEELEVYEIFKPRYKEVTKCDSESVAETKQLTDDVEVYDEVELYFAELTKPKPNIFKGLIREKVCEICEKVGNLVKCKSCNSMFHIDCVKKQTEVVEVSVLHRGRKKKKRQGRKPKNSEEFDNEQEVLNTLSEDNNVSIEEIIENESCTVDADVLEAQLAAKMKEMLNNDENIEYDSYSSDEFIDWHDTIPGKCEIIDVKLKPRLSIPETDYSDFKCNTCEEYTTPICFVCKSAVSNKDSAKRQKCHVAHCYKYYHLECLDHWPQTQFYGGEPSKNNKKSIEHFEAFTCPRHVCHTCVSDDPRGCKTRFSGDKLARCLKCPATYHSFTKCLPAGSKILTASHIICPRHYEHRAGKAPCHVNTGWCFICALGGSLICCEYCPTSFHAECLNIDPPEGGYMCEDCETGRLPLYGEMVWVKLGHYRWWPGIILHPYEIPENIWAVKHSPGEFVVRFFGQYDHYWVNRGRVFPFQEGDSGRISSQKSKIDAAFTTAVEHAQRACEILKAAQPNEEESLDIASSLLPPHYVKLKVNKPCGSLCGRKLEDPESSLTQCECNPHEEDPCGPYSQCLNRMLLTECGPTCRAGDRCNNRAFEKRLYPKLVPYRTPSRGWGLKTLEDIKAGQFVIEYVGELIDEEEFRRRMRRKHEMRDENFYFLTLDKERMIDAGPKGNFARFMNHCCEPNCETQKWTVLGDVRVGLFALFDIPAHSEVTFNYNLECAGIDKKRCMCGAKRCSGYIGAKPKQEESQPKKNKMHPGKRTYKKRKPEESPSTKNKGKRPIGRPRKPKELTEIEKDLLIIRNATNTLSSDESNHISSSDQDKNPKALKRKRVSFSSEDVLFDGTESPNTKKSKLEDKLEGD